MSAVKSSKVQVGISTNANNNFVIDASQADGTLKISRGNIGATTQTVLEIPATEGSVSRTLFRAAKNTTSGTSVEFSPSDGTGIPSWAKRVTVILFGVSTSGAQGFKMQAITSGGVVTSGYTCVSIYASNGINAAPWSDRFFDTGSSASTLASGRIECLNVGGNNWIESASICRFNDNANQLVTGSAALSNQMIGIRLSTNGADTFDAGSVALLIEG